MKNGIIVVAAAIIAFVLGFFGIYMMMPSIDPEMVQETERALAMESDTTGVDSMMLTAFGLAAGGPAPAWVLETFGTEDPDSIMKIQDAALRLMGLSRDSLDQIMSETHKVSPLQDSLTFLNTEIMRMYTVNQGMQTQIQHLENRWDNVESQLGEASAVSGPLAKLEDAELAAIVQQLDPGVLRSVYAGSSSRVQGRLIKSMTPEQAAAFVSGLVRNAESRPVRPVANN